MTTVMLQEILEQPDAIDATIAVCEQSADAIRRFIDGHHRSALFIARGTSDSVADYGQYLLATHLHLLGCSASPSIATAYRATVSLQDVLAIAISQSGSTAEIVDTASWAAASGADVLALTNVPGSPLARAGGLALVTQAGREKAVPATKSYTTAIAALVMAVATAAHDDELRRDLDAMVGRMREQLGALTDVMPLVELLVSVDTAVFASRGYAAGAAREASLKLKETSGINAIGSSLADLVHGPVAAIGPDVPLVLLSANRGSPIHDGLGDLARRAHANGAPIIVIGDVDDDIAALATRMLALPPAPEHLAPLALAVPTQLLAEAVSRARGLNPDSPRGLSKVTQTI